MFIYQGHDVRIPTDIEAYYEALARQEEIYLEEAEEELRAILIFGIPSPSRNEILRSGWAQVIITR